MAQSGTQTNATERPFFRYDLVTEAVEEHGNRFVDVTDPTSGRRFRFYEVEYAVACGMDGERDVSGLIAWAKEELGLDTDPDEVRGVVSTLSELGYLAGTAAVAAPEPAAIAPEPEPKPEPAPEPEAEVAPQPLPPPAAPPVRTPPVRTPPPPPAPAEDEFDDAFEDEVTLGAPGRSPFERERPAPPEAPDLELGLAGRSELPPEPEAGPEDIPLGLAGAGDSVEIERLETVPAERRPGDVSLDLSAHDEVSTDDVKEAVRQSRVMPAVEVPKDVEQALEIEAEEPEETGAAPVVLPEAPPAAAAARAEAKEPGKKKAAAAQPAAKKAGKKKAAAAQPAAKKAGKKKAAAAQAAEKKATPVEAAPERRSSAGLLLWLLLLAAVGAGAYYVYTEYVAEQEPAPPVVPTPPPVTQAPPPKPAPPTATLVAGEAPSADATAPQAGTIAWIATAGTEVEESAPVAKLAGFQRHEKAVERATRSRDRYRARRDAAEEAGNARAVARHQNDVDRKNRDLEAAEAALAPYLVLAPITGIVEPTVEVGAAVEEGAEVARVTGEAGPVADFAVPTGSLEEGAEVTVTAREDGEVQATCTVLATAPGKARVECPIDSGLAEGTTVLLK